MHFSPTVYHNGVVLVLKDPTSKPVGVFKPYQKDVWYIRIVIVIILIIFLAIASVVNMEEKITREILFNCFTDWFVYVVGSQFSKDIPQKRLECFSIKISVVFLICASMVLSVFYSSNMMAIFATSTSKNRIENLEDALQEVNMKFLVGKGTAMESLLKNSTNTLYSNIWKRILYHGYSNCVIPLSNLRIEGLKQVREESTTAALMLTNIAESEINRPVNKRLYIARAPVYSTNSVLTLSKRFAYIDLFVRDIQSMVDTGNK